MNISVASRLYNVKIDGNSLTTISNTQTCNSHTVCNLLSESHINQHNNNNIWLKAANYCIFVMIAFCQIVAH